MLTFFQCLQLSGIVLFMFLCYPQDVDFFSVSTVKGGGLVFVPVFSRNLTIFQCLQLSTSGIVLFMFLCYPGS